MRRNRREESFPMRFHFFPPYLDRYFKVNVRSVFPRTIYTCSVDSRSIRARRRHLSTRDARESTANGEIDRAVTIRAVTSPLDAPRRSRRARERVGRRASSIHVGALSTRARRPSTSRVDVVRRVDARAFSRAIAPARASEDVLGAMRRRRDAREAPRQGQATAARAPRPSPAARAARARARADARVESRCVAPRGGVVVRGVSDARGARGGRARVHGGRAGGDADASRADSSGETRVGDDSSVATRSGRCGAGDGAAPRRWVVVGRVDAPGV